MKKHVFCLITLLSFSTLQAESIWESNGNFGFGTSSPQAKVHVVGSLILEGSLPKEDQKHASWISGYDSNHSESWWVGEGTSSGKVVSLMNNATGGSLSLGTLSTPRLMILPSGNIGIGTQTPLRKVQVIDNPVLQSGEIMLGGTENSGLVVGHSNLGSGRSWITSLNNASAEHNNRISIGFGHVKSGDLENPVLVVDQWKRVGIGTQTPRTSLDVNGVILAQDLRFDQTTWADFVFEPEYPLMPLHDVETYIKTHKHLPGMPSEQEIMENGISVKDIQPLLLQKIEELTLYTLQLEKRISELEK